MKFHFNKISLIFQVKTNPPVLRLVFEVQLLLITIIGKLEILKEKNSNLIYLLIKLLMKYVLETF